MEAAAFLLISVTGEAHEIELVWSRPPEFGVRYTKSTNVRVFVDPEFEPLKAYWAAAGLGAAPR